jgi:solute carrier family 25 phosphate transporter 3
LLDDLLESNELDDGIWNLSCPKWCESLVESVGTFTSFDFVKTSDSGLWQTSEPGTFPKTAVAGFNKIKASEGTNGYYKGLTPLWARQIPYTIVKFVAFEKIVQQFYTKVFTKEKSSYSKGTQMGVTFASGYIAGVFCAIVSHPADTMVSILNKRSGSDKSTGAQIKEIYGEIGFAGLWKGLGTRIFMIGTLTCLQWVIYDSFKIWCGLQTTGGK